MERVTIRTYSRIDFLPKDDIDGGFNMWDMAYREDHEITENVNTEDLHQLILKITGNKQENYNFLINYLAHMVQFPEKKPEVAIFFTSAQGSGKDTLIQLIKLLLGENLLAFENDPERVFGKFNMGTRQNKLVVVLQEADNIKNYSGKIKDLITCKETTLEQKNVRSFTIKDYTRLFLLSNKDNILPIEPDDRRFVVFKPYDFSYDPDMDFFTRVYKCLDNPNCIQQFINELRSYNIDKYYNFQSNRPHTEIYNSLKQANTPSIIKWLHELVEDIKFQPIERIETKTLINKYNDYCAENYENSNRIKPQSFGLAIRKYFNKNDKWVGIEPKKSNSKRIYQIDKEELKDIIENKYNYVGDI